MLRRGGLTRRQRSLYQRGLSRAWMMGDDVSAKDRCADRWVAENGSNAQVAAAPLLRGRLFLFKCSGTASLCQRSCMPSSSAAARHEPQAIDARESEGASRCLRTHRKMSSPNLSLMSGWAGPGTEPALPVISQGWSTTACVRKNAPDARKRSKRPEARPRTFS